MQKKTTYRLIISILVFFYFVNLIAQPSYRFRHLKQENGLKNSSIHAICQDKKGFIWIGTEGGIFRYDGFGFKVFTYDPNNTNSLNSNVVFALYVDDANKLWIGSYRGLIIYDQLHEQFIDLNLSDRYLPGQTIPVYDIIKSYDNEIWIGCQDIGIVIYDPKTNQFNDTKSARINRYLKSKDVNTLLIDSNENCWIGTLTQGLVKFIPGRNKPVYFDFSEYTNSKLNCNDIIKVFESSSGDIWVATRGGGVFRIKEGIEIDRHFKHNELKPSSIGSNEAYDFWEDSEGQIWISTNGSGLNIYNYHKDIFTRIRHKSNDKYSLLNDNIRELYEDNQGNLWVASFQAGVNIHINSPYKFNHYYFPQEENLEYRSSTVLSFYAEDNIIWVGTDGGGLKKINRNTGNFITYLPNSKYRGLTDRVITTIYKDYQGIYWLGTYLGGLIRFDAKNETFKAYNHNPSDENSISHSYITAVFEDQRGNFWIGTNGGGMNLFDKSSQKFKQFIASETDPENSLVSNYINVFQEDSNGDIWVGTYWGLSRFSIRNFSFRNYKFSKEIPGSLSHNVVLSLLRDSKNRIWVGTRMGLNLYDREKDIFSIYTENDGLAGSTINGILEDSKGIIWVSTNNGISKYNPETKETSNFYFEDGLQGNEFHHGSYFKSANNEFFFGGYNGFSYFFPDSIKKHYYEPEVILTSLHVQEKEIKIGKLPDGRMILDKNISETKSLDLNYSDKSISINFAAIDYIEGTKNVFAYKLEGFDDAWKYTTHEHPFATYTNLAPGNYTFLVKAGKPEIIDDIERFNSLDIYINPPLWRTWWAYILYLVFIGSLIFYFWRLSIQRVKERNQIRIEKMKREQVESVTQARMSFYTNISHDIRTPLTLIIGPLEQLLAKGNEVATIKKQLDVMLKNARRLLRLINQLLDFRKIEMHKMRLHAENSDIVEFIRDIVYSFEEYAIEKRINFSYTSQLNKCFIWFDPDKLDKAMFNLLSNAFKFTPEKGSIKIEINSPVNLPEKSEFEYVEIIISDTGKGISPKDLKTIFERFYQGKSKPDGIKQGWGLGLSLSKNYIELHKGEIFVESIENAGTNFKVYLPIGDSHLKENDKILTDKPGLNKYIHYSTEVYRAEKQVSTHKKNINQNAFQVLIVEDNIDLRDYLIDELSSLYNCFEANNGKEGFEMATEIMPDIIISDVMMPEMDGNEFCKAIKENIITSHIPIILLTAKSEVTDQIEGLKSGADLYLSKPFRPDQLIAHINSILENRLRLKEKFSALQDFSQRNIKNISDDKFIVKTSEIIMKHIADNQFGVNELSQELGISRVHLHRKMKAITRVGPNEFIRKIKLQKAAELLLQNDKSIAEICIEVGFSSTTYFSSCFKSYYNVSPKDFLNKTKGIR